MRFGEIGLQRQRALRRAPSGVSGVDVHQPLVGLGDRQQRPRAGVLGIDLDGALAQPDGDLAMPRIAGRVVLPRHQVELVRFRIGRRALLDRLLLGRQQLQLQRLDDGFGDLVLQREDVVQIPVEALGPEVAVGRAVDELRGDAHAVARLAHAPLEHVAHLQLARHLRDVDVLRP